MSWRLRVVHTTGYRYSAPVTRSYNEVRLTPRSDARQNLVVSRVETAPATRSYRYTDYWGATVTAFDLHAPHTELQVISSSVVETADAVEERPDTTWTRLRSAEVLDRYTEVLERTDYTAPDKELKGLAGSLRKGCSPAEAVSAVCTAVHEHLSYVTGSTGVRTSAAEAWSAGTGVCQDYAHSSLVLLRQMGIPARYVSGYLHTRPDGVVGDVVRGESHAWIEAWTGGWWAFDPTNDIPVGNRHVLVAAGRDYADVVPLKGVFSGGKASALQVTVEITRLA